MEQGVHLESRYKQQKSGKRPVAVRAPSVTDLGDCTVGRKRSLFLKSAFNSLDRWERQA